MADEGEKGGRRTALFVPCPLYTEMPSPLLARKASITVKVHMLMLLMLLLVA